MGWELLKAACGRVGWRQPRESALWIILLHLADVTWEQMESSVKSDSQKQNKTKQKTPKVDNMAT